MTSKYPIESFYRATIVQSITPSNTPPFALKLSNLPLLTKGFLTLSPNTVNEEIVYFDWKDTVNSTVTITIRAVEPDADDILVAGTDYDVVVSGTIPRRKNHASLDIASADINNIHLNTWVNLSGNNIFSGNNTFSWTNTFTGSNTFSNIFGIPVFANTWARDAAIPSPVSGNTCIVTGTGYQYYSGWTWNTLGVGSPTPNGSETVSGSWEWATLAEMATATDLGWTGAHLVPMNKNLKKTFSGAADENKIPVLNSSGTVMNFVNTTGLSAVAYSWLTTSDKYIIDQSWTLKTTTPAEFLQQIQNVMKATDVEFKNGTENTKYTTAAQSRLFSTVVAGTTYSAASIGTTRVVSLTYPGSPAGPNGWVTTVGNTKAWTTNGAGGYRLTGTLTGWVGGGAYWANLYKNGVYVTSVAQCTVWVDSPKNFSYDYTAVNGDAFAIRLETNVTGTTNATISACTLKYDITFPIGTATAVTD